MAILYQITSPYYCAGITVENGKVVSAAPILRWTIGREWENIKRGFLQKGFKVTEVSRGGNV
jgi:hypothetical protein